MTIYDFTIEYDRAKDKFYLSKGGELLQTFYGDWALKEYLYSEYNLCGPQVVSAIQAAMQEGKNMKKLEIRIFVDIDETQTDFKDIEQTLYNDFSQLGNVKRVDLIDEIEI